MHIIIFILPGSAAQRGLWPPSSRGFVITHNDAPQSVGLLWTSDQLIAQTSDNIQHTEETNTDFPGRIQTHDRSRRLAVDLRLRPRDHWDRHNIEYTVNILPASLCCNGINYRTLFRVK
jgi:hypothetical protein